MGIFNKIRKHFRTKPNKEEQKKQPPNPKQIEWAKIAYEQALKNKSPFINHESAGAGELDEKIILTIAKANKFDIDDSCGLHEPIETYDEETLKHTKSFKNDSLVTYVVSLSIMMKKGYISYSTGKNNVYMK